MTLIDFAMNAGMAGAAFMLGVMTGCLRISAHVRGLGIGVLMMLVMGSIAAISVTRGPVVEPLWLHYVLFALVPYLLGISILAALSRPSSKVPD